MLFSFLCLIVFAEDCIDSNNYTLVSRFSTISCDDVAGKVVYESYAESVTILTWSSQNSSCTKDAEITLKTTAKFGTSADGMTIPDLPAEDSVNLSNSSSRALVAKVSGSFPAVNGDYTLTGEHKFKYIEGWTIFGNPDYKTDTFPSLGGGCTLCVQ